MSSVKVPLHNIERVALNNREDLAGLTEGHVFRQQTDPQVADSQLIKWCVISKKSAAGYVIAISDQKAQAGSPKAIRQAVINLSEVIVHSPNAVFGDNAVVHIMNYEEGVKAMAKIYASYRSIMKKVARL